MQASPQSCDCRRAADHAAFERETMRALASTGPATARGRLRIDKRSLRRALGGRAELVEAMEAKAVGRPGANASVMWRYFTTSVYQSGDLPVLAAREALQNGVDAIKAAVKARKTRAGQGRFAVSWDEARRALTFEDNGIGMDAPTILGKFLSLGESGKSGAGDSEEAAGGFGVAKAVILGTSPTFRWELHTRDNLAVSEGADQDVRIYDAPFLQGTRITIFDVAEDFDATWDYARQETVVLADRLRELLAANDLRGIELVLDGETIGPMFSRRAGSKVKLEGSWGRGTTATVKAYRRPPGDRRGAYYLRLGGLFQFRTPAQRGNLKADVVLDLLTDVRPGARGYPFNAARDALQDRARWAFSDLVEEVERENESVGRNLEDEVFDPDSEHDAERRGAQDLADLAAEAFADEAFQQALADAAGGIADFYAERAKDPGVQPEVASTAPAGTKARRAEDTPTRGPVLPPGLTLPTGKVASDIATPSTPGDAARQLRDLLTTADEAWTASGGDEGRRSMTSWVQRALDRAESGQALDEHDVAALEGAMTRAGEIALSAAGGGLVQAAGTARLGEQVFALVPATAQGERRKKRKRNPFGGLAGLRISRKNYDRRKAGRFKNGFRRWIPHLTAWDATLRLVAVEARIRRRFKPGFVLDDELIGLTTSSASGTNVVYLHPDRLAQVVKAHKQRPLAIAAFLHGVACHELSHLDGRMGEGHSEEFVSAREDLGHATGHLLPAIAVLVTKVLDLKLKPSQEQKQVAKLERQLAAARAKAKGTKKAGASVARLEAALEQAQAELVDALEQSAEARAACGHACPTCQGDDCAWSTPGTRLRGTTLAEWVQAWRRLDGRRASSARHAAMAAHLEALPDAVVEAASAEELDALVEIVREAQPSRGRRQSHPTTRLFDAVDRRRRALGTPAPRDRADRLLDAATAVLRAQPPAGVDLDYFDGFVVRHRDHLHTLVQSVLERRAARGAQR